MPYLSIAKRGFISKFDLLSIVMAILFKLKTGCQCEHLPVCHFFEGEIPIYKTATTVTFRFADGRTVSLTIPTTT